MSIGPGPTAVWNAAFAKLLGGGAGEVLNRRFGAGVSGVKRREGAEQRGDQRADFTVVVEVFARLFQEEERGFGVDRRHLVVLGFADVDHRLFQHFADGIDGDIRLADGGDRIGKQFFDRARGGEIGLQRDALRPGGLNGGDGFSASAWEAALL